MKTFKNSAARWASMSIAGLVVAGAAMLPAETRAATSIIDTRHNLGTSPSAITDRNRFSGTDEVCVFCHTPHAAATNGPPLWNKTLPSGPYTVYSVSNSSTIDGRLADDGAGGSSVGSVSIACLSCHDGTAAMNSVINAPGSGLTNAAYTAGTWTARATGGTPVDTGTGILGAGVANLGTDLSNDHPIGIQYCGGGNTVAGGVGTCRDPDFVVASVTPINGTNVFWVETGGNGTRNKTDMILYNRSFPTDGTGPSVECASCHDPHNGDNATFLRIANSGSAVCLSCHVK